MNRKHGAGLVAVAGMAVSLVLPAFAVAAPPAPHFATRAAAVPGRAPASARASAVYLDASGAQVAAAGATPRAATDADGSSAQARRLGCTPYSGRDNPHYSSGDVSGHGWWDRGNCGSSVSTAHVVNCLYEWYTDNTFRRKACSPTKQLKPGGGSVQRTVARATCNPSSGYITWRNHVDVDVDGKVDTPEEPFNDADVVCVVF